LSLRFIVIMLALILLTLGLAYFVIPGSGSFAPATAPATPGHRVEAETRIYSDRGRARRLRSRPVPSSRRGHHRGKGVREAWAFPGPSGGHDAGADPTMAPRPSRGVGLQGLMQSPPVRPRTEARQRANEAWALCRGCPLWL
jgi:hypothetical protein